MRPDPRSTATLLALLLLAGCGSGRTSAPRAPSPAAPPTPASPAPSAQASAPAPPPVPTDAPALTDAPAPAAETEPLANTLRWSTASEVDNFGFAVYRAEAEEGPFTRLTATPLPGAGTSDEPHAYRYVDTTIEAGKPYFYYVESISLAGERERFTPLIRARAKGIAATPPPSVE